MSDASFIMKCPACGKSNRIPANKAGVRGRCGNCKEPLPQFYNQPLPLQEHAFDTFINSYPGPVLAEFWAPW